MFFLCAHNHVKLQKWRHRKTQRLRQQSASGETLMLKRVVVSAAEGEQKHLYSWLVLLHLSFLIFCEGFRFGAPQGPPRWRLAVFFLIVVCFLSFPASSAFQLRCCLISIFDRQSFKFLHHSLHSWPTPSTGLGGTFAGATLDVQCTLRDFRPPKVGKSKGQH